ncbi:12310_t:CDS:2 [Entrophospora sp. SA101]|nr:12310_t:CDS:2 [Entrophospora sp. SA101]
MKVNKAKLERTVVSQKGLDFIQEVALVAETNDLEELINNYR